MLRRFLELDDIRQAFMFASVYSQLDFFTHILELLLHDILEDEADIAPPEEGLVACLPVLLYRSVVTASDQTSRVLST